MKLIALIQESPDPKHDFIIVRFKSDKTGQHFQVFVEGHFKKGLKQGDEVLLNIRFKSVVMKNLEGNKTYDTHLYTDFILEVTDMMRKQYK